jgi:hypothetical protein
MIKINVTREDIMLGQRGRCEDCPIAIAIRGVVKDNVYVNVGAGHALLSLLHRNPQAAFQQLQGTSQDKSDLRVKLPEEVINFIHAFDYGDDKRKKLKPFNFQLDIPDRFLKGFPDG